MAIKSGGRPRILGWSQAELLAIADAPNCGNPDDGRRRRALIASRAPEARGAPTERFPEPLSATKDGS